MGMSVIDVVLTIVYMAICYGIGNAIKNKHRHNPLYKKSARDDAKVGMKGF